MVGATLPAMIGRVHVSDWNVASDRWCGGDFRGGLYWAFHVGDGIYLVLRARLYVKSRAASNG